MVSPFAEAAKEEDAGAVDDSPKLPLTMENVDEALDEVRPYLVADGGNVELVKIEDRIVVVRLNGACGTCASSSATMKGGIEKLLKQKFGDAVEEVVNVSGELGRDDDRDDRGAFGKASKVYHELRGRGERGIARKGRVRVEV